MSNDDFFLKNQLSIMDCLVGKQPWKKYLSKISNCKIIYNPKNAYQTWYKKWKKIIKG